MEIREYIKPEKIIAFQNFDLSSFRDSTIYLVTPKEYLENSTVLNYLLKKSETDKEKIEDSLKMVALDSSFLEKKVNKISTTESLKMELALSLLKKEEILLLDHFSAYFMEKELMYFKKLFKKLVKNYHKTILLFDSNLKFFFDLVDTIVVKDEETIRSFENPDFYNEELLSYFNVPKIIQFVQYVKEKGIKIPNYIDLGELIKEIYREVS